MTSPLKQILMAVLLAGGVAVGQQKVTLDTLLEDAQGNRSSLYENQQEEARRYHYYAGPS